MAGSADDTNGGEFDDGSDGAMYGNPDVAGTTSDYATWTWKQIEAAIVGGSMLQSADQARAQSVSSPSSLWQAGDVFNSVMLVLQNVAGGLQANANQLAGGDDAPWQGAAAQSFTTMMTGFSNQVMAAANVLSGGASGADSIPDQLINNGNALLTAQTDIEDIDSYYAQAAVAQGAPVMGNGLVEVSAKPVLVAEMTGQMQQVLNQLVGNYRVTIDSVIPPSTVNNPANSSDNNINSLLNGLNNLNDLADLNNLNSLADLNALGGLNGLGGGLNNPNALGGAGLNLPNSAKGPDGASADKLPNLPNTGVGGGTGGVGADNLAALPNVGAGTGPDGVGAENLAALPNIGAGGGTGGVGADNLAALPNVNGTAGPDGVGADNLAALPNADTGAGSGLPQSLSALDSGLPANLATLPGTNLADGVTPEAGLPALATVGGSPALTDSLVSGGLGLGDSVNPAGTAELGLPETGIPSLPVTSSGGVPETALSEPVGVGEGKGKGAGDAIPTGEETTLPDIGASEVGLPGLDHGGAGSGLTLPSGTVPALGLPGLGTGGAGAGTGGAGTGGAGTGGAGTGGAGLGDLALGKVPTGAGVGTGDVTGMGDGSGVGTGALTGTGVGAQSSGGEGVSPMMPGGAGGGLAGFGAAAEPSDASGLLSEGAEPWTSAASGPAAQELGSSTGAAAGGASLDEVGGGSGAGAGVPDVAVPGAVGTAAQGMGDGMPMMPGMGGAGMPAAGVGEPSDASGLLSEGAEPWTSAGPESAAEELGSPTGAAAGGASLDEVGAVSGSGAGLPDVAVPSALDAAAQGAGQEMPMMPGMGGAGMPAAGTGDPSDASGLLGAETEDWAQEEQEPDEVGSETGAAAGGAGLDWAAEPGAEPEMGAGAGAGVAADSEDPSAWEVAGAVGDGVLLALGLWSEHRRAADDEKDLATRTVSGEPDAWSEGRTAATARHGDVAGEAAEAPPAAAWRPDRSSAAAARTRPRLNTGAEAVEPEEADGGDAALAAEGGPAQDPDGEPEPQTAADLLIQESELWGTARSDWGVL